MKTQGEATGDAGRGDDRLFDGFKEPVGEPSLVESHRTVDVAHGAGFLRRFAAFLGPGFLVAVGYMDPGNWATSIAGGSEFGYTLLTAVLLSSLMAILLQALCARFAIVTGRDLAQACRDAFPRPVAYGLWVLAELAIIATDLAEVIGTAIGLQLLFGLPLVWGVVITALDVFLILYLQSRGFRWVEAFIVTMILVIAICFVGQLILAEPSIAAILGGFLPTPEIVTNDRMLYLALGILGATVMPHNLYLHTGIVQTRAYRQDTAGKRDAIRFATLDSTFALGFALLAAIKSGIYAARSIVKKKSYEELLEQLKENNRITLPIRKALDKMQNKDLDRLIATITAPGIKQLTYNTNIDSLKIVASLLNILDQVLGEAPRNLETSDRRNDP